MSPTLRARLLDSMAEVVFRDPTCPHCDPQGGCPNDLDCRLEQAERLLAVIDREQNYARDVQFLA